MNKDKKLAELELTIKKAQEQIEELKKPKTMFERGENGDKYCFINGKYKPLLTTDHHLCSDNIYYKNANYYLEKDKHIAERVAKYYQDNNWFIRKAIEFADGYDFVEGKDNWFVCFDLNSEQWDTCFSMLIKETTVIYMTEESALKFIAWLEEYKPEGNINEKRK